MCVFSSERSDTAGRWCAAPANATATASGAIVPSSSGNGCSCTPLFIGAAAASYRYTWARAGHRTSVPGVLATRIASWFAIVPDGT